MNSKKDMFNILGIFSMFIGLLLFIVSSPINYETIKRCGVFACGKINVSISGMDVIFGWEYSSKVFSDLNIYAIIALAFVVISLIITVFITRKNLKDNTIVICVLMLLTSTLFIFFYQIFYQLI